MIYKDYYYYYFYKYIKSQESMKTQIQMFKFEHVWFLEFKCLKI